MTALDHLVASIVAPDERLGTVARQRLDHLTKPRGSLGRLEELAVEAATSPPSGAEGVDVAVHHLDSPERAARLAERLRARLGEAVEVRVVDLRAGRHLQVTSYDATQAHTTNHLVGEAAEAAVDSRS